MSRPRLLDGCCAGGGAGTGYAEYFDVVGVDIEPQPHYPFEFVQADIRDVLADRAFMNGFDAAGISPTCQSYANVTNWRGSNANHLDLLTPTLELLADVDIPWVVENVPEAAKHGPLRADLILCGTQFDLPIKRHRAFQFGNWSFFDLQPPCRCYRNPAVRAFEHKDERAYADAMGCTWMPKETARQAIPPAYTRYIGRALLAHLQAREAA